MESNYGYKYGRTAAVRPIGYKNLATFFTGSLPEIPATFDPLKGTSPFRMMGNGPDPSLTVHQGKPVGDCGFVMTVNANIVTSIALDEYFAIPTSNQVVSDYLAYDNNQDVGVSNAKLLPYWADKGLWGNKIAGYGAVNFHDFDEAMAVSYLYLGLCTGIVVTQAMEEATQNGEPWDFTGQPADYEVLGGHDVYVFGRVDAETGVLATWGQRQLFTKRWWQNCVEECDAVVTNELVAAKGDKLGLDLERLQGSLSKLNG